MSEALIIYDPAANAVSVADKANDLIETLLSLAALIPDRDFKSAQEAEKADSIVRQIKEARRAFKKGHEQAKRPLIDAGREIDTAYRELDSKLDPAERYITKRTTNWLLLQQQIKRAEEQKQREELARIEREKAAEIAKAKSLEEVDQVREKFSEQEKNIVEVEVVPATPKGQSLEMDWEIREVDVHKLYADHPNCCKLEYYPGKVKELLERGIKVSGVKAERVPKTRIRGKGNLVEV